MQKIMWVKKSTLVLLGGGEGGTVPLFMLVGELSFIDMLGAPWH